MLKQTIIEMCKEKNLDTKKVLDEVRNAIGRYRSSWASLDFSFGEATKVEYRRHGYRKDTTGEYVSNSYRNHFGWKNTHYVSAKLTIVLNENEYRK